MLKENIHNLSLKYVLDKFQGTELIEIHEIYYEDVPQDNEQGSLWVLHADCPEKTDQTYILDRPTFFDNDNLILHTADGLRYKIISFICDKKEFLKQVVKDIEAGGYQPC